MGNIKNKVYQEIILLEYDTRSKIRTKKKNNPCQEVTFPCNILNMNYTCVLGITRNSKGKIIPTIKTIVHMVLKKVTQKFEQTDREIRTIHHMVFTLKILINVINTKSMLNCLI